ncbi:MAG: biotin/lipoyl-containing protein, partial [Roseitalea porphyridii]
ERASFPEALAKEGIVWIGPNPRAIMAMGDKIESKKFANEAKVSTVPGYLGVIESPEQAVEIAADIGYPVMIKASAGGGGKGMRIAWNEAEARDGFERSKSEAASSFGDDRIFIEKFVEQPRHIEIQVLADAHGNCIHLGERECSIQRRNQKVIEEAPSPFLDEETRAAMGEQAVALAKAVDYQSAGTVEFIVDKDRNFYFLEMNTRLQVEHPVTELVTGLDLVEQMIRVAAGEKLAFRQEDIELDGWAIESRVYAEDPVRGFLPSIGRLTRYRPPAELRTDDLAVRNDTGVFAGAEISMFYDPMIAKLCTWAPTRVAAIDAMSDALDAFVIDGIAHNIPFLSSLMAHPRWRDGRLTTNFIAEEYPDGFASPQPDEEARHTLAAIALSVELIRKDRLDRHAGRIAPHSGRLGEDWVVKLGGDYFDMRVAEPRPGERWSMSVTLEEGQPVFVETGFRLGDVLWTGTVDGQAVVAQIRPETNGVRIDWRGHQVIAHVMQPHVARLEGLMPEKAMADTSRQLLCPMPGLVVSLAVEVGQSVQAGQTLAVIEAMKMENVLRAERDGTISVIHAEVGDSLAVDAVILEFE